MRQAVQTPGIDEEASATRQRWRSNVFRLTVLAVGASAVSLLIWDQVLKYRFIAKRWGVVVPGKIYRSGQISKWVIEDQLKEYGIEVIVDLTGLDPRDEHQQAEIRAAQKLGLQLHRFPLRGDGTGKIGHYAAAIGVLADCERRNKPVLVHCAAGAQRTGGVVAAYRVLVRGESPQTAYAELDDYGWDADSDQALLTYLNGHMRELAELLVEQGVIESVPDPLPIIGP